MPHERVESPGKRLRSSVAAGGEKVHCCICYDFVVGNVVEESIYQVFLQGIAFGQGRLLCSGKVLFTLVHGICNYFLSEIFHIFDCFAEFCAKEILSGFPEGVCEAGCYGAGSVVERFGKRETAVHIHLFH